MSADEPAIGLPAICLIVARGRNGVIGTQGDLPWRLSSDLKHFKAVTSGKPIVMGRKTWDSLPRRPLPGRLNIVVSRQAGFTAEGGEVAGDLDTALVIAITQAQADSVGEVFVIGGAQIYAAALGHAHRLYITEVEADPAGDAVFPTLEAGQWSEISREVHEAGPGDEHNFVCRVLERV
ncbi:dihydrofolate reductase [Maricaulis salignorans]|uniref:Dihydrofolate reductase n=1 Tax=Maricaulis salignorans TaxID=144026 RepID=A0A1G9SBI2_9PROT|nr:dihydrofolate reductase [Maricaulis salignorans]SDM32700.1 dihydrofolate reductase [Maricaulis salignorans]